MSSSSISAKKRFSDRVDCEMARRGVWLVKVTAYIHAGRDVGTLIIKPANGKTDIIFKSTPGLCGPSVGRKKPTGSEIPGEYTFVIADVKSQSLNVLSEGTFQLLSPWLFPAFLSEIDLRANFRFKPRSSVNQIEKSSVPKRQLMQIDKAEVKFKPVAVHTETLARERQKKEGAKTVRGDKDVVRQAIFHAFEKTVRFPFQGFVKEILTEIAMYNTTPPHKSMWELKPEYRSYGNVKKTDDD
uniref:General transcription factor IIF subunit 2 n=1 Tax=Parascaris equorum TaxID=6256 RepID=A0A914RJQ8_PAREQ